MSIKVKLPRTVSGKELADVVEASMNDLMSIDSYKVSKDSEYGYQYGSLEEIEVSRDIVAKRGLSLLEYACGVAVPVVGWMYLLLSGTARKEFQVSLDLNKDYGELKIEAERYGVVFNDLRNEIFQDTLKPDFDKLVKGIYSRLGQQPQPAYKDL